MAKEIVFMRAVRPGPIGAGGAGTDGVVASGRSSRRIGRATDGFRYARVALFIFLAASVDVFNYLDRGGSIRYAILLIPIGAVILIQLRRPAPFVRRPRTTDKVLFMLWLLGTLGGLYGVLFAHGSAAVGSSTDRPIFLPMSLAFVYLFVLQSPSDEEAGKILRWLTVIGAAYIFLAALVNYGLVPHLATYKQFRNAQLAFVMIGLAGAIVTRRLWLLALLVGAETLNFVSYPSATTLLCIAGTLLTFFLTKPQGSRARPYLVALAAALVAMLALANISAVATITGDYFVAVGKTNANNGRLAIWTSGVQEWQQSPIVGHVFAGGTVAQAVRARNGQLLQLPFHDDYVLFLAQGGLVGIGLFLAFIFGLNFAMVRKHRAFVARGRSERAGLLRVLLVGFNAFFVAAAVNPVLEGMSRSAVLFSLYGIAMLICAPDGTERESQSTPQPRLGELETGRP